MKRWLGYFLFFICSYALFLLATLPASHAYSFASQRSMPLSLAELTGTVWQGTAQKAVINNTAIGPVHWRFQPLSLLLGKVEFDLSTTGKSLLSSGSVGATFTGTPFLSGFKGDSSVNTLASLFQLRAFTPTGRVKFDLPKVQFENTRLSHAEGRIQWNEAGITQPAMVTIGKVAVDLTTDDNGIHGQLSDLDATLAISGKVDLLKDGRYQIRGQLQPKPTTPPDLANALNMLGQANAKGGIDLHFDGQL